MAAYMRLMIGLIGTNQPALLIPQFLVDQCRTLIDMTVYAPKKVRIGALYFTKYYFSDNALGFLFFDVMLSIQNALTQICVVKASFAILKIPIMVSVKCVIMRSVVTSNQ